MIQIGRECIGKPLDDREAEMYRIRPPKIAPFMPEFKGKPPQTMLMPMCTPVQK